MGFKLRPGTSVFGNVTFTPGTNENYVAPPVHGGPESTNIALTATSTASTHISDRPPSLAHDGIIGISDTDGSTISGVNAWVTTGERVGAWMQLDWSTPQTVNKIKLYDRPNVTHDHIKGGTLTFSDGSSVTVGELPDGVVNGSPDPLEVTFDAKTITWVRFTVDAFTGHNAGLTEFEVFGYEYQAPAPSASWLVVGAYGDSNNNGYDGGAAYVYDINDLSAQPTKLIAFDGDETARFGNSSAATSDKIFIRSKSSGSVYVYDANNLTDQPTKITIETGLSSNTTNDDICVMGDKLFVSSFKSSEVRVYNVNDLSADPVILTPSASTEDDRFGWTMAVSDEKLVVSATRDDYNGILNSGAVYVYDINDLTSEPTKLRAFDGAAQDQLGSSVDVSADKIVVGASSDDDHGSASGSVYVFDANDLSAQPTKLTAFDAAQGDGFGVSVSINSDKIVVGATGDDDNGSTSGSVYVYDASDLSAQPTKLTAFDGAASDYFGAPVLIVDDKIIVGAHRDDDNATDSGSVYVYDANDLSAQPTKLTAFDGAADDYFGRSVAVG